MNAPSSTRFPTPNNAEVLRRETTLQNGAFIVREVLGRGGFGITYRAHDTRQNREVAIKELFTNSCCRVGNDIQVDETQRAVFQSAKARFLAQARILSQLRHPNIVRVSHFFEENATAYLVMELLSGQTLLDIVHECGALREDEALGFIEKIADATEAIHRLGLLHLDIKPENVIVTRENRVVLMDFDLVQKLHAGEELDTRPLDSPSHCGTPGYAPVEQYSVATRFSPATDIYAIGATLHHLVTGRAPLPALERAHDEDLRLPDFLAEKVKRAIEKSLQTRIENRPRNVRAFRELLYPSQIVVGNSATIPANTSVPKNGFAPPKSAVSVAASNHVSASINTSSNAVSSTRNGAQNPANNANLVWRVAVDGTNARNVQWPQLCPCCGEKANDWYEIGRGARTWRVPHCDTCVQHIDTTRTALFVGAWGMSGGLIIATLGLSFGGLILGPLGLVVHTMAMSYGALQTFSAETMKTPNCCDKKVALRVREANNARVVFEFLRHEYADEFKQLNGARWG